MSDKKNVNEDQDQDESGGEGEVRQSIKVYMIRHAESMNNEVYRDARQLYKGGTPQFDFKGWKSYVEKHRTADPSISSNGIIQAEKLKEYLVSHLNNQASHPVEIITSPMNRTIQTILPTLQELQGEKVDVVVNGMYFESEGCHLKNKPLPGMNQHEIKDILSSAQIHHPSFVGFDEDPNHGWYSYGKGPETRSESETRSSAFYTWFCDYLDEQLEKSQQHDDDGIYDAGVSLPEEAHELDHDKLSKRYRKRRTAMLIGHGDFMSLCLKRMITGFGHSVENCGIPHRTAFTHFNTGITELEYFGKGRFLMMHTNDTPHLNSNEDRHLKTGGSLKDGWSYLMPQDKILLYEEVTSAFVDELDGYVEEQTKALRNLYLQRKGSGSFLIRKKDGNTVNDEIIEDDNQEEQTDDKASVNEMTFFIQRGLQVVACANYHGESNLISDMVMRPSAKDGNLQKEIINAVITHAKKEGKTEVLIEGDNEDFYTELGFVSFQSQDGERSGMMRAKL